MTINPKNIATLTLSALLGLTLTCQSHANPVRQKLRTDEGIRSCIAEIAKHADYQSASRIMHWVAGLDQRNVAELEIRIDTTVYVADQGSAVRAYRASCVTGEFGWLVGFRIDETGSS